MKLTARQRRALREAMEPSRLYYVASKHAWVPGHHFRQALERDDLYFIGSEIDPLEKASFLLPVEYGRLGQPSVLKASGRALEVLA